MTSRTPTYEDDVLKVVDGCLHATVDVRTYRLVAVQKAAYKLADKCTIVLGSEKDQLLPITFMFQPGVAESAARQTAQLFFQELLDQELREHIASETNPMRALILAQAFSKSDLVRR
jgi:His-Xaa-Ser system protein HxsD